jgi:hypothetical protein
MIKVITVLIIINSKIMIVAMNVSVVEKVNISIRREGIVRVLLNLIIGGSKKTIQKNLN